MSDLRQALAYDAGERVRPDVEDPYDLIVEAARKWADLQDQEPVEIACPFCEGSGKVPEEHDYATEWLGCPDCQATGRVRVRLAAEEEEE